jgi:hypothetical protein
MGRSHPAAGCIALYATSVEPVISARLIGFARGTLPNTPWKVGRIAVHSSFPRGALFTMRLSGGDGGGQKEKLYNLPLYYK